MDHVEEDRFFHELAEEELKEVQLLFLRDIFLFEDHYFQFKTDSSHELLISLLTVHRNLFEFTDVFVLSLRD